MTAMRPLPLVTFLALLLPACAHGPAEIHAVASEAPLVGKADGGDQADRECRVVLREVSRLPAPDWNGYERECAGDVCTWIFTGHVDVSRDAFPTDAPVGVLYRVSGDSTWWEIPADATAGGRAGFFSHVFKVREHVTIGPDSSEEALAAFRLELIPFVRLPEGGRLFDHNRRAGDFDTYSLGQPEWFSLSEESACQAVVGALWFQADWQQQVGGMLHAGGWLEVNYALERLPDCRGTHNGYPAWNTEAFIRFLPYGQIQTGSVRDFVTNNGTPTTEAVPRTLQVRIPADATAVEVWFRNSSGAGMNCEAWDSNYGANYRFDVWPAVDDPRCADTLRFTNNYGGLPACTMYSITQHADATNCEFYLSAFGHVYEGHYGIPFEWLEAYLVVNPQQGELLNAGMFVRYTDTKDGSTHGRSVLGALKDGNTWKTGFTYNSTAIMSIPGYRYQVDQVAFFIDVRRPSGEVVRLWQSHCGANYSWDDAFGAGTIPASIPYGNAAWAGDSATIFDSRRACQ
jgi:hypothetical protein